MHPWIWAWVAIAVLLALGEAVTGGFVVMPWAIGAAVAAALDAAGAGAGVQWLAFVAVSSAVLVIAQRIRSRGE